MESTAQEVVDIAPQAPAEEKKKQQRPSKYTWDRNTITLETKLVELPKKTARLAKPEFDAMEKKIKEVEDKIKQTIERKVLPSLKPALPFYFDCFTRSIDSLIH